MIINIGVFQEADDQNKNKLWGYSDFSSLPLVGHNIVLPNGFGGIALLRVQAIEHSPVMTEPDTAVAKFLKEKEGPLVKIFVSVLEYEMHW